MVLNLLLLMFVTLIPFPTGLLADHLQRRSDEHVAAAVYAATLLAMSIALLRHLPVGGAPAPVRRLDRATSTSAT